LVAKPGEFEISASPLESQLGVSQSAQADILAAVIGHIPSYYRKAVV
jgi:hypothetical protein